MSSFVCSLLEINLLIVLFFSGYLLIRNQLSFKRRRMTLIGGVVLAAVVVVLKTGINVTGYSYQIPVVELQTALVGNQNGLIGSDSFQLSFDLIYKLGVIAFTIILLSKLVRILLFFLGNSSQKKGKYRVYQVDGKESFSFFNFIQISPNLLSNDQEIVLEHEKMHVDKKHSFDILLIEILHVLFWFNPTFLWIKRELINLHEFEVDEIMYRKHKVGYMQFLLSYAMGVNPSHYLLTSQFYNRLTLKKRIKTMKTNRKNNVFIMAVIPLMALALTFVSWTSVQKDELPENKKVETVAGDGEGKLDKMPQFPGGNEAMYTFIGQKVKYPEVAKKKGLEGTAHIKFMIKADGSLEDVQVKKSSSHPSLDEEAIRVIKAMPKWEPGEKSGKKVSAEMVLPIAFKLTD